MRLSTVTQTVSPTVTVVVADPVDSDRKESQPEALVLRLNRKKKVSWKPGTVDNEFMQKKSSKKCCIFHKQKSFDEDDSDEDHDHTHNHNHNHDGCHESDGASSSKNHR